MLARNYACAARAVPGVKARCADATMHGTHHLQPRSCLAVANSAAGQSPSRRRRALRLQCLRTVHLTASRNADAHVSKHSFATKLMVLLAVSTTCTACCSHAHAQSRALQTRVGTMCGNVWTKSAYLLQALHPTEVLDAHRPSQCQQIGRKRACRKQELGGAPVASPSRCWSPRLHK